MTIEQVDRYESKVFYYIDKYEQSLECFKENYSNIVLKIIAIFEWLFYAYCDVLMPFEKMFRYLTFPFHWIDIWLAIKRSFPPIEQLLIFELGGHYIYGPPGSGKSTTVFHAMMQYAYETGKKSYTTAHMELPRTNLNGTEYYYHQVFEPSDFFKDGEQIASFDKSFNIIVYEEMLDINNHRRSVSDEILPLITAMGTQRHQGIDLFYFISQLPRNDIQLMLMLKGYHQPKIKKGFDYMYWLQTGLIRFSIKGWHMTSQRIAPTSGMDYELVNKTKWFYPNIYPEEFEFFNKLNMKDKFDKLPTFKGGATA